MQATDRNHSFMFLSRVQEVTVLPPTIWVPAHLGPWMSKIGQPHTQTKLNI